MKRLLTTFLGALLVFTCAAQQPSRPDPDPRDLPGKPQQRLNPIVRNPNPSAEPQTQNYQLEFTMTRAGKSARYLMTFNGGQISTDLLDKLAEQGTNAEPKTINFSVSFIPFEDGGGEALVMISRTKTYKTKVLDRGGEPDGREVVQQKNMGLKTKVALRAGKPVVIFDDEDEKITLKLTEL